MQKQKQIDRKIVSIDFSVREVKNADITCRR